MGKTWLIWMLFLALREGRLSATCWISFAPADEQPPFTMPPDWLSWTLVYQPQGSRVSLTTRSMALNELCDKLLRRFGLNGAHSEQLGAIAGNLQVAAILPDDEDEVVPQYPDRLVLFLDGLDQLEQRIGVDAQALWEALQTHLLRPLYLTGRVLCFTTGQGQLVWRYFELARVVHEQQLPGLTPREIREMARHYQLDPLAGEVYMLTQGHPYLAEHRFRQTRQELAASGTVIDIHPATTDVSPPPVTDLGDLVERLAPASRQLLPVAALLRSLDLGALATATQQVSGLAIPPLRLADLHAALGDYLAADLLTEHGSAPLRYLWRAELVPALTDLAERELDARLRTELHRRFADWYAQQLETNPQRYGFLINEWMFHSLSALPPDPAVCPRWAEHFRWLWWRVGSSRRAEQLFKDASLQELLAARDCQQRAAAIIRFVPDQRERRAELYPQILDHLRQQRIRGGETPLSDEDIALLRDLAALPSFGVAEVRQAIGKQRNNRSSEVVTLSEAMERLERLTTSYVVIHDEQARAFVVEPWLKQVLTTWRDKETEGGDTDPDC
ncbi:MAG: hypothetical protein N2378_07475 [Chloroflexaceae bacterium]|nr:hypothetical protein [Chloroflexaceae bacterium]